MQSPLIIFDHIKKKVAVLRPGNAADKRVEELIAGQREQIATSGRPK